MGQLLYRPSNDFLIRKATDRDIDAISDIASRCKQTGDRQLDSNTGFLISDYTYNRYRTELQNGASFWVVSAADRVVTFLIAYHSQDMPESNPHKAYMDSCFTEYWYVFQIATDPEFASQGFGRAVYSHFLAIATGLPVFASIVTDPPNYRSYRLHISLGFHATEFDVVDSVRQRMLFLRSPLGDFEQLKEQYAIVQGLYVHEDNLNWTKLATFFSVTAIFIASFGFTNWGTKLFDTVHVWLLHSTLVNVAICVMSRVFAVSLRSGVHYMNVRRRSFLEIDKQISCLTGNRIITPAPSAPTTLSLLQLPVTISKVTGSLAFLSVLSVLVEVIVQLVT